MDSSYLIILFITAWLLTTLLTPLVMKFAHRVGAVDSGGFRKIYEGAMPLLGGLAIGTTFIFLGLIFSTIGFLNINFDLWKHDFIRDNLNVFMGISLLRYDIAVLIFGSIGICALGLYDDIHGMRARNKFLFQIIIATLVCLNIPQLQLISIPLLGEINLGSYLGLFFSILWIVGLINALNIIDGVDGLASGVTLIACLGILVLGSIENHFFSLITCTILAGSLIGFLRYNFHPARIFLGDTGSMLLGFLLASITLIQTYKAETAAIVLAPILALGLPILEVLLSMGRRWLHGQPIFTGDNRHTHHRLLSKGYSQTYVVLLLYTATFLMTSSAVISSLIPKDSALSSLPIFMYIGTTIWIIWLADYLRPSSFNKIWQNRSRNSVLQKFNNYAIQSFNTGKFKKDTKIFFEIAKHELNLSFIAAWFEEGSLLIGVSGEPINAADQNQPIDNIEKFRVKSLSGNVIIVRYQFLSDVSEDEHRHTATCLASIFEKSQIDPDQIEQNNLSQKVIDFPFDATNF